jgi:hypothetical protein
MTDFDRRIRSAHILEDEDRALRRALAWAVAAILMGLVPMVALIWWALG